jgi:hypothetical protein
LKVRPLAIPRGLWWVKYWETVEMKVKMVCKTGIKLILGMQMEFSWHNT